MKFAGRSEAGFHYVCCKKIQKGMNKPQREVKKTAVMGGNPDSKDLALSVSMTRSWFVFWVLIALY
jgi:hypothetical protein